MSCPLTPPHAVVARGISWLCRGGKIFIFYITFSVCPQRLLGHVVSLAILLPRTQRTAGNLKADPTLILFLFFSPTIITLAHMWSPLVLAVAGGLKWQLRA